MLPLVVVAWGSIATVGVAQTAVPEAIRNDPDYRRVRAVLAPDHEIAGLQEALVAETRPLAQWWPQLKASRLVVHDFNRDGQPDLFVAVEPRRGAAATAAEATAPTESVERWLEVHLSEPDGQWRRAARASGLMLSRDESGMQPGDPFGGLRLTPRGTVELFFAWGGGRADFEEVYRVQVRGGEVLVIGVDRQTCDRLPGRERCVRQSVNLLTQRWQEEHSHPFGRARTLTRDGIDPNARPVALTGAQFGFDPCRPATAGASVSTQGFSCGRDRAKALPR